MVHPHTVHLPPGALLIPCTMCGIQVRLFGHATKAYVQRVVATRKPRAVVLCMLYYLDETRGGSWADATLQALGYDRDPSKLQLLMRVVYRLATSTVAIDGVEAVVPLPMYEALDGQTTDDYVQRVEPSSQGGRKLAALLLDRLAAHGLLTPGGDAAKM